MKTLLLLALVTSTIFAQEFYAKLEAIKTYKVKASVAGKVIYINDEIEAFHANNSLIIKLDDKLNQIDLKNSLKKLNLLNEMIAIENRNYNRLKKLKSKSAYEKDTQKLKVITLQSNKADLESKIENLKDTIKNKKLMVKSNYIFNISVQKGDYVNPGTLLYESMDLSKAKLEFYVPIDSLETIKKQTIYLDGKQTDLKINKIYKIADSSHLSSYKIELVLENINKFSRLIKIEFK